MLRIEKSVDGIFYNPGSVASYKIVIKNNGFGGANNVSVKDLLPEGFSYTDYDLIEREWQMGNLNPGETKEINYSVFIGENVESGFYTNEAEVFARNHGIVQDTAVIEVRNPIVLGEETTAPVLPNTGSGLFENRIFLAGLFLFFFGIIGLTFFAFNEKVIKLMVLIKNNKKYFGVTVFLFIIFTSLIFIAYPFFPSVKYHLFSERYDLTNNYQVIASIEEEDPLLEIKEKGNYLLIPKIGVEIPIIEGEDDSILELGAWLLPQTSPPDDYKNTAIAAHRFKNKPPHKETFYLLDKLEKGDLLLVIWEGKEYNYFVESSFVVDPDGVEVLEETEKATLTLITCYPLFSNSQRLIVRGIL